MQLAAAINQTLLGDERLKTEAENGVPQLVKRRLHWHYLVSTSRGEARQTCCPPCQPSACFATVLSDLSRLSARSCSVVQVGRQQHTPIAMIEAKNAQRKMRRGDQLQYKIGLLDVLYCSVR